VVSLRREKPNHKEPKTEVQAPFATAQGKLNLGRPQRKIRRKSAPLHTKGCGTQISLRYLRPGPPPSALGLSRVVHSIRAMFCPKCKAEYRPGFTRCSDCEVDLVEALPKKPSFDCAVVWRSSDKSDCVEACRELDDAGLDYDVLQVALGPARDMDVERRYEIRVSRWDVDRAKEVLGTTSTVEASQIVDQEAFELPENPVVATPETERRGLNLGKRHAADAVVEVWSQRPEDTSSIVELSLKTNLIPFRVKITEGGARKFLVSPEDESAAREILRQIRDGTPPT
jgi:hypothetical protein